VCLGYLAGKTSFAGYNYTGQYFGEQNVYIGYNTGQPDCQGYLGVFIGARVYTHASGGSGGNFIATGIGAGALGNNTAGTNGGDMNDGIGATALASATSAWGNMSMGFNVLGGLTSGGYNTAFGAQAGKYIADGATLNQTSKKSLYFGYNTKALADGDNNEIVIGYNAIGMGTNSATLGNSDITKTILRGSVGIGTTAPSTALQVVGTVACSTLNQVSDARLKTNIETSKGLEIISKLRGVSFNWKADGRPSDGVIAQEIETVMPEAVLSQNDGMKTVGYDALFAPVIESVKELRSRNPGFPDIMSTRKRDGLKAEIKALTETINTQDKEIEELRVAVKELKNFP